MTDFSPSALVARLVGVDEFAMGSTLAFRRADLEDDGIRGHRRLSRGDYQLGHRIHALGVKCVLSESWWRRIWAAGGVGVGAPGAVGTDHSGVAFRRVLGAAGDESYRVGGGLCAVRTVDPAAALLGFRLTMAFAAGWGVLRSRDVLFLWWLSGPGLIRIRGGVAGLLGIR